MEAMQQQLFPVGYVAIYVERDSSVDYWSVRVGRGPAYAPWSGLETAEYGPLSADESLDVLAASLDALALGGF